MFTQLLNCSNVGPVASVYSCPHRILVYAINLTCLFVSLFVYYLFVCLSLQEIANALGRPPTSPSPSSSSAPGSGSNNNDNSSTTNALTSTSTPPTAPSSDLSKEAKVEQINEKIAYLSREIEKVTTTS